MGVAFFCSNPNSLSSLRNQIASLVASISALYSLSVEDGKTVGCFFEHQVIGVDPSLKRYALVDLLSSKLPAQSESEKPTSLLSSPLL